MTTQRELFIERFGRWFFWTDVKRELDAIPESDMKNCQFIH